MIWEEWNATSGGGFFCNWWPVHRGGTLERERERERETYYSGGEYIYIFWGLEISMEWHK